MMTRFEDGHESGANTAVPLHEIELHDTDVPEVSVIPHKLQGRPADQIVRGIRSLRLAEIANQNKSAPQE